MEEEKVGPTESGMARAEDLGTFLACHPLLGGLPGDVDDDISRCCLNIAVRAGQYLLVEGEPANAFYLIRRGQVSLETRAPGRLQVLETLGPGAVLGWSWLFPPYRWRFDARAVEPVGAVAVDATCLRSKAETDPNLGYELMKRFNSVIVSRLDAVQARLSERYSREVKAIAKRGWWAGGKIYLYDSSSATPSDPTEERLSDLDEVMRRVAIQIERNVK